MEQNIEKNIKIKVNSSQFNYQYKKRIHFPFSISLLVTYLKSKTHIDKNFKFEKSFIFRNEVEKNIADNIKLPLNHPDFIMVYKIDDQLFGKNNLDNRLLSRVKRKING